jgi:hypothetical protein
MRSTFRVIGAGLVAAALAACGDGTTPGDRSAAAVSSRIDALEKRLAAIEKGIEPLENLPDQTASLDRRLSSLETSVRELAARRADATAPAASPPAVAAVPPRPAPSQAPAPSTPRPRADRTKRRAELRALSDEFRIRLAELRQEPGGTQDSEKTREILDWYREQRRAILRGDGRTDR